LKLTDPLFMTDGDPLSDSHLYRSLVGALLYATITRPDIAFEKYIGTSNGGGIGFRMNFEVGSDWTTSP
jgi:hypothetical protein